MRLHMLSLCLALVACNTPGRYFDDVAPVRVAVDGARFDVRVREGLAEVIRTNPRYAPRRGRLGPQAVFAIEQASGCRVTRLEGDAAKMLGWLDCGAGAPSGPPPSLGGHFDCYTVNSYESPATEELVLDLDCERL